MNQLYVYIHPHIPSLLRLPPTFPIPPLQAVTKHQADLRVLIFYSATLLNSFILNFFLVASIGFSIYSIMSYANHDSFLSFFPIWICFLFFLSCLIAVTKTSNNMLNKSGKSRHLCLVSDLRGNVFSFSPLRMMFAVGLSYMSFIMLM